MPIQYEGIMAEHAWKRDSAGLFDVSHMGQLSITGENVATALEALMPAAIHDAPLNKARYSLLLSDTGGVLDDLMLTPQAPDRVYMVVNGATNYDDVAHIVEHLPDDVTLNLMEDHALLAVQGPEAVEAVERLVPGVKSLTLMQAGAFAWNGNAL